ncbi:hypothetical protein C723_1897 [Christiangramia flava JLT2011]|uniref:Uncharacterized protein n=1 Tax=Christiangramia flava JLT2011 TaxID=1229726 RepID=A0A1L7I7M9_9FLAO|nr:hypothetical protein GRFL_2894 [Christiangramia flava JLT2011]OSS39351.1 hypothetical protein C723_1897 [Christiangramia flava JLT2011]
MYCECELIFRLRKKGFTELSKSRTESFYKTAIVDFLSEN